MKLVFATNNKHKLEEIQAILPNDIEVLSLSDINCNDDIEETADTLEGNALIKARHIYNKYGMYCFADDTGLEVEALNNAPGVRTARYANDAHNDSEANMNKLLRELSGVPEPRTAQFRTAIALIDEDGEHLFEGIVRGSILMEREGNEGFGYDPVFCPDGYEHSFAVLGSEVKNKISHRARAVNELMTYLCSRN